VQGDDELVGSDSRKLKTAIANAKPLSGTIIPEPKGDHVTLIINLSIAETGHDVYVAEAESGLKSDVKRGENAGLVLQHTSVVHKLLKVGHLASGEKTGNFRFSPEQKPGGGRHWVAFVQEEGLGPVQAVAIW
jgi:hypothetical protein